jgi:hypothetical protein
MPSDEDLELARRLAHEIDNQAHGTKQDERVFVSEMANAVERVLSDEAQDQDRATARELLDRVAPA